MPVHVGAVNTVTFEGGKRVGRNTDWWGFAEAFKRGLPDVGLDRVLLLGAGGAGAAVAYALGHLGATEVVVTDIDQVKAADLIDRMNANGPGTRYSLSSDFGQRSDIVQRLGTHDANGNDKVSRHRSRSEPPHR